MATVLEFSKGTYDVLKWADWLVGESHIITLLYVQLQNKKTQYRGHLVYFVETDRNDLLSDIKVFFEDEEKTYRFLLRSNLRSGQRFVELAEETDELEVGRVVDRTGDDRGRLGFQRRPGGWGGDPPPRRSDSHRRRSFGRRPHEIGVAETGVHVVAQLERSIFQLISRYASSTQTGSGVGHLSPECGLDLL